MRTRRGRGRGSVGASRGRGSSRNLQNLGFVPSSSSSGPNRASSSSEPSDDVVVSEDVTAGSSRASGAGVHGESGGPNNENANRETSDGPEIVELDAVDKDGNLVSSVKPGKVTKNLKKAVEIPKEYFVKAPPQYQKKKDDGSGEVEGPQTTAYICLTCKRQNVLPSKSIFSCSHSSRTNLYRHMEVSGILEFHVVL